ncbi:DNA-binding transcriptional regulator LsrR (DeoR family) [Rhodobacter aestuarii]|uniref:DNA-binding transcriptional regulator LsrR, DeoR family n=1 Tax=Rhodobacter aestuarii TaxID=453582 RepID=A0A1N7MXG3_9RHOB|nr:sugar-binding domain-containing protein [Rhodobacter aestuarii]PTV96467.1 DNA-binding transcriptional regulator LsrR (DeoR family) [Rhodobacter aestuarii]SIS90785.1 DNA-binding transcriptional regulator LsrR, DeoR family [Rhodobacter aestuarii]
MTSPPHRLSRPDTPESRARWLHEVGGLTVEEIGWRLGLPAEKVKYLLEKGESEAVLIPGGMAGARLLRHLSRRLRTVYGLSGVHLAPFAPGETDPIPAIASVAARWLTRLVKSSDAPKVVGLSHGRSLAAMVRELPEMRAPELRFVSLLGELTLSHTAYPHVVMNYLAQRFGAQAFPYPATLYVTTPEERAELMRMPVVAKVTDMARMAEVWIVGIGRPSDANQLLGTGMILPGCLHEIDQQGAECEILGRFFDGQGQELTTSLAHRTLSPLPQDFAGRRIVGLAGGPEKVAPIRAALRGGLVQELVTDTRTAVALLDPTEHSTYALLL